MQTAVLPHEVCGWCQLAERCPGKSRTQNFLGGVFLVLEVIFLIRGTLIRVQNIVEIMFPPPKYCFSLCEKSLICFWFCSSTGWR